MKVTQTIQLDDNEKEILEKAFSLIDKISNIAKTSMDNVFDYLIDQTDITNEDNYLLECLIDISKL